MKVREVMSFPVVTVSPEAPYKELVQLMLDKGISCLPVVDDRGCMRGIVTEADLVSKQGYGDRPRSGFDAVADVLLGAGTRWANRGRGLTAADVMSIGVSTTSPAEDVRVLARRMVRHDLKRLPVLDDEWRLVGIVSRRDVLRLFYRSDEQIVTAIRAALANPQGRFRESDVAVSVDDGIVTLTGEVAVPSDVAALTELVWDVPGVVAVDNQAEAGTPLPAPADYATRD